jgi:hypothetical protein
MEIFAFGSHLARGFARVLVALAFAGLAATAAAQNVYLGTVFTGLYSVPGEAGSGVTATHEEPVIFLTFYLYRGDRSAYWLTATVLRGPDVNGSYNYTGDLYETSGPPVGEAFDPATVTYRKVGTVSLLSKDGRTVALTYTIDGKLISKTYTRFTLNPLDFTGTYAGTILHQTGSCSAPTVLARSGPMKVTQSANALTIVLQGATATCTLSGDYTQSGSWGGSTGSFSCTDGTSGPMVLAGMQMTTAGFTASFGVSGSQCNYLGAVGGVLVSRP